MILIYENFPCVVLELWEGHFIKPMLTEKRKIEEKIYKVMFKNEIEIISQISKEDAYLIREDPVVFVAFDYIYNQNNKLEREYKRIL